ncbi:methylated-DNA--[protein]-cysteine S-methyltransferase [Alkalicoccus luteus]|uniref:Methylated-DNA--protein-cysteine methyltransferase n=1 Tax=Alkalicoccus luteus TaxID=1237094 RepID=A0A969PPP5_9BACI|nr:methylated-DNA--[protein]-cysteine S-methyltransferase [Alkalicoccus luteus]NJP36689.1 methylated-DNA--[protein]-cysteine S-methyltransferase [Alkalicoccus luteus]
MLIYRKLAVAGMTLSAAAEEDGVSLIHFDSSEKTPIRLKQLYRDTTLDAQQGTNPLLDQLEKELDAYFLHHRKHFTLPIKLIGTAFQKAVWKQLVTIPYGETRSYKEIAEMTGSPKAVRAVGGANNRNPLPIVVPCHRVIGSNGSLVGYAGGLEWKKKLLSIESSEELLKETVFIKSN